jgi:hypothetical protein
VNEHRVHLPVAGDRRARAEEAEPLPIAEESARKLLPVPSVAVAGAGAIDFVHALSKELVLSGHSPRVWLAETRVRGGADVMRGTGGEWVLRASPNEMDTAIEDLVRRNAPTASLTIAMGAPFIALRRATISVLVTRGVPLLEWDRPLREIRDRFDIVVTEPRPMLAHELVQRLVRR